MSNFPKNSMLPLGMLVRHVQVLGAKYGIVPVASLLALLVALPTLFAGFFIDDYVHLLSLDGKIEGTGPLDLFRFAPGDAETLHQYMGQVPYPWFTLPDLHIHFCRPLSSGLMALDRALFGRASFWYHAHSIAWYVLLVALAATLYRRLFPLPLALLCALLFALDDGHAIPAGWWSNRNALVAATPAFFALLAHLKWREGGAAGWLLASMAGLILGLLGGEGALGICGYLLAYELMARREPVLKRLLALSPAGGIALLYLLFYKLAGYGVSGSGMYLDPMGEFSEFLQDAPARALLLFGAQFLSLPSELPALHPSWTPPLLAASALTLAFCTALLQRAWRNMDEGERRNLAWLLLGAAISTVPVLATFASGRLLVIPSLGGAALLGCLLRGAWRAAPGTAPFLRVGGGVLALVHLLLAPLAWPGLSAGLQVVDNRVHDLLADPLIAELPPDRAVVLLNAPDPVLGMYPFIMLKEMGRPGPKAWWSLTLVAHDLRITRAAENRLEVELLDGPMLDTPFEQLFRSLAYPLQAGEVSGVKPMLIEALEMNGAFPSRLAVHLDPELTQAGIFLIWKDSQFQQIQLPAIGDSIMLPTEEALFSLDFLRG